MKKNNLVFIFTFNYKAPVITGELKEQFDRLSDIEKQNFEDLRNKNLNSRIISMFGVPFESINLQPEQLRKLAIELRNKLAIHSNTENHPLINLFGECLKMKRYETYENVILKEVLIINSNDLN